MYVYFFKCNFQSYSIRISFGERKFKGKENGLSYKILKNTSIYSFKQSNLSGVIGLFTDIFFITRKLFRVSVTTDRDS